jgi:hypothetical protein
MFKKVKTLTACFIVLIQCAVAQNVYTVNNTPGAPANYHTLQGAIDSVAPGSILMLQASALIYGSGIIRKPLVIYGPGYFLGQNTPPNTQAKQLESMVEYVQFLNGSQGSIVSGISLSNPANPLGLVSRLYCDSTSNITVSRCRIGATNCNCPSHNFSTVIQHSSNISIKQCYIELSDASIILPAISSGISFTNNIFVGGINPVAGYNSGSFPFSYTFDGNSFYGNLQNVDFTNGSFTNNVIIQSPAQTVFISGQMTFADHNVSNVNIFPVGGTNINNADGPNTYTLFSNPSINSQDGSLQLKPGSVAIGYGTGGIDAGAYGGTGAYVLSGIPAIPNIYFASVPQTGTTTGGLKVHLKIKANN